MNAERQTEYRPLWLVAGSAVVIAGAVMLAVALSRSGALPLFWAQLGTASFGWSTPLMVLQDAVAALGMAVANRQPAALPGGWLWAGAGVFVVGWALIAAGIRRAPPDPEGPSEAAGAPLHPKLQGYRDFYWTTLLAYGGGILGAELVLVVVHTALAVGVRPGASLDPARGIQLAPPLAFGVAALLASAVAFAAGFLGASRARRLAAPEATIAMLYLGLPLPGLLTALSASPQLEAAFGYRLREVTYLAGLIGRPELGYWLAFAGLMLVMILGITSGFVATGSGRVNLRAGFELFVARRHAAVFRPLLLGGVLLVLLFGIIAPIIIYAIVRAAGAAVERTRIRKLGLADPLKATRAMFVQGRGEPSPTDTMTALSVGGVGVGVMALIIVLSVMSGFEADLQEKILGTNAHAVVQKYDTEFPEWHDVMKTISQVPGIKGQTPFIYNEVMLTAEGNIAGTIIKGVDPDTVGSVSDLTRNVTPAEAVELLRHPEQILEGAAEESGSKSGSAEDDPLIRIGGDAAAKGTPALPGIIIGRELASQLRVMVGDRVNVVSPVGGELGPQGPMPKSRPFRVAGIFYSGMYEYDSKFVYILLEEAQRFFNVKGVTGIELKVENVDDARRISREVLSRLKGYPYRTRDWGEMNKNLFSALRLEKLVMGIILSVIVIVAAGLIVATVIMLVLEKRKEISVLKALGVPDGGIVKIFLAEGLQIGVAGGLLGLISGLVWCKVIEVVGIKLDPEVYYIPSLPVRVEPLQTALAVLIAVLVTYLGSIWPALKASRVDPVEGLKAE